MASISGLDPLNPVSFDLTKDQPDNPIKEANGNLIYHLSALQKDLSGQAVVELYGDLRRHNMGTGLAERIDEVGTGASVFLTENLWVLDLPLPIFMMAGQQRSPRRSWNMEAKRWQLKMRLET